jgi:hypothetical protein
VLDLKTAKASGAATGFGLCSREFLFVNRTAGFLAGMSKKTVLATKSFVNENRRASARLRPSYFRRMFGQNVYLTES